MLADLEEKQQNLRATLLRTSGSIQVFEEELDRADAVVAVESIAQMAA